MPEYLVELYSINANSDSAVLARLGDGNSVRYLRSILIPATTPVCTWSKPTPSSKSRRRSTRPV